MQRILNVITFPFTLIFWVIFFLILLVFHGLQWLALNLVGKKAHKKMVDIMNLCLMRAFLLVGVRFRFHGEKPKFEEAPLIIVSNHQSMFDIPPIIWFLRKVGPKFIAKKELGRGIPGISYNLRHGGSALIDRSNRQAAMKAIENFGIYMQESQCSGVIFPEGTRSDGPQPKAWKIGGLVSLMKACPNAGVLPITIHNSWKIFKHKGLPIPFGTKVDITGHPIVRLEDDNYKKFVAQIREIVESPLLS